MKSSHLIGWWTRLYLALFEKLLFAWKILAQCAEAAGATTPRKFALHCANCTCLTTLYWFRDILCTKFPVLLFNLKLVQAWMAFQFQVCVLIVSNNNQFPLSLLWRRVHVVKGLVICASVRCMISTNTKRKQGHCLNFVCSSITKNDTILCLCF